MSEPQHEMNLDQPALEVGQFKVGPRGTAMLLQALSRGTPRERLVTGVREAFQNALDASLKQTERDGQRRQIAIDVADGDIVIRDNGVGLSPDQINDLLLSIFESGKTEGVGGFGVGAGSVLQAAPDVVIRTRKVDGDPRWQGRGAVFKRSWIGEKAPELMSTEESQAFGQGTEIRLAGIVSKTYEWEKVPQSQVMMILAELIGMSELPADVELVVNGEPYAPLLHLGPNTKKLDSDLVEVFPGALVEHHIVPLPPEDERGPYLRPMRLVQLADPRGSGWALAQWNEYIDTSVNFMHVVRIRPTVRPEDAHYPFNYERTTIADDELREAVSRASTRFVTDRLTAVKQQEWRHTYYTGTESERRSAVAALSEETKAGRATFIRRLGDLLQALPESEVQAHLEERAQYLSRQSGKAVTVEELIADQPTMIKRQTSWKPPAWLSSRFDPDKPESIRPLAPILAAMRVLGTAIRNESRSTRDGTFRQSTAPYYGFIFSNENDGMLVGEADGPLSDAKCLLINPAAERFRTARTPEALCDMLLNLLAHEHAHEAVDWHNETFTTHLDTLHDGIANLRPELHRVFKESGAWQAWRKLQRLPLRATKKSDEPEELEQIDYRGANALRDDLPKVYSSDAVILAGLLVDYAQAEENGVVGGATVGEAVAYARVRGMLKGEYAEVPVETAKELGIRRIPEHVGTPMEATTLESVKFQERLIAYDWYRRTQLFSLIARAVGKDAVESPEVQAFAQASKVSLLALDVIVMMARDIIECERTESSHLRIAYNRVQSGERPADAIKNARAIAERDGALGTDWIFSPLAEAVLVATPLVCYGTMKDDIDAFRAYVKTGKVTKKRGLLSWGR